MSVIKPIGTSETQKSTSNPKMILAQFLGTLSQIGAERKDSTSGYSQEKTSFLTEAKSKVEDALKPNDHELVTKSEKKPKEKEAEETNKKNEAIEENNQKIIASWTNVGSKEGVV
jgi:hypothetical protein